jgi:hypothetical protein
MPSMTLTVDAAQAARLTAAFGRYWHLTNPDGTPRDATLAEVRDYLVRQLRGVVREMDRANARAAAEATISDLTVT